MTEITRRVLITGAASGIGAATARRLADPGTALLLHTRGNADRLEAVAAELRDRGSAVETMLGDLADAELPGRLVRQAAETFGGLDALIANAGWARNVPLLESTMEHLEAPVDAIARGFALMAQAAAPHLKTSACGRVVAVSAFGPHVYRPGVMTFPGTAAAKAALETHVRSLAFELAADGVTVNAVVPGFIQKDPGTSRAVTVDKTVQVTAQIPMGRLGSPDEVAAVIVFLMSREAGYVTGQCIHVNGGLV
ncbi:SDR family NAD(P)-dependent oxidoreductase [Thalassobaculum sp.]|uniref:SDR family NAD(P)-dependent oxidoreductase n=1 Tax=Thalassobaculum sp. TaxID=2022740 RepID=UPI003B5A58F8